MQIIVVRQVQECEKFKFSSLKHEMDEKCVGCACGLRKETAQRRKLYSPSTHQVLPVLLGLYSEEHSFEDVDKLLLPGLESKRSKLSVCA